MTIASAIPIQGTRPNEFPVSSAVEGPLAIDEALPGSEEVKIQEQPMEKVTGSPIFKDDLIPATAREGLFIDQPLPGLEEDVNMQDQSIVNGSTQSKYVPSAFYSQTRNNPISAPQRSRNSAQP